MPCVLQDFPRRAHLAGWTGHADGGPALWTPRDDHTGGTVFVTSCFNQVSASKDGGTTWQTLTPAAWPLRFCHSWPAVVELGPEEIGVVNVVDGSVKIRFGTHSPARPEP